MRKIIEEIIKISKNICKKYEVNWRDSFFQWSNFEQEYIFDFSVNFVITIANIKKKKIEEINKEIEKEFKKMEEFLEISSTKNGYINFSIKKFFYQSFIKKISEENKIEKRDNNNEKINIEYVSANPTGNLHIGNIRHAIIGEILSKVYDFLGFKITREYYINDKGNQIDFLVNLIDKIIKGEREEEINKEEYYNSAKKIAEILIKKNIDENKENIDIKKETIKILLNKIKQQLKKIGVKFDVWFSENSLYKNNKTKELLIKRLKNNSLIYKKDGAVFFDSKSGGDDKDRVLIKSDGNFTYFFSDIMYQENKIKRGADKLILILGSDHHGYIKRLKNSLELLSKKKNFLETIIVQMVGFTNEGKFKKFSKRMENNNEENNLLKIFEKEEDKLIFFLAEKNPNQIIKLDIEYIKNNWKKTRFYYIQYAYARCCQIIKKTINMDIYKSDFFLESVSERKIISLIMRFEFMLEKIIEEKNPSILINYLINLSKLWQQYYQNNQIINNKNIKLSLQRIMLTKAIKLTIEKGLNLIGIKAKKRMKKEKNEKIFPNI